MREPQLMCEDCSSSWVAEGNGYFEDVQEADSGLLLPIVPADDLSYEEVKSLTLDVCQSFVENFLRIAIEYWTLVTGFDELLAVTTDLAIRLELLSAPSSVQILVMAVVEGREGKNLSAEQFVENVKLLGLEFPIEGLET